MNVEISAGDAIQIGVGLVLTLTLAAVLWYAWEARKQAKASVRMATEMEQGRYDSLRPVIDVILREPPSKDWLNQAYSKAFPAEMECRLRNIGVGPALNIEFYVYHPDEPRVVRFKMGALAAGESDGGRHHHLTLEGLQERPDARVLRVWYEDVFGRALQSWREASLDEDGGLVIGPLRILVSGDTAK